MGALQTSQCFLDSTCSVCGTLDGAFKGAWISTMCVGGSNDDLKAATSVKISPNTGHRRITEDLYICGIDVFESKSTYWSHTTLYPNHFFRVFFLQRSFFVYSIFCLTYLNLLWLFWKCLCDLILPDFWTV